MIGRVALRLLLVAAFTSLLILSSTQAVFAATERKYDDGECNGGTYLDKGGCLAVRFSLPSGWSRAKVITARFYKYGPPGTEVKVHILASDGVTELTAPFNHDMTSNGWNDIDPSGRRIIVAGDFYVAFEYLFDEDPALGFDIDPPWSGRSYWKHNIADNWIQQGPPYTPLNYMIRAVVDTRALVTVGGYVTSVNALGILAPYIAVVTLGVAAAVTIKRRFD